MQNAVPEGEGGMVAVLGSTIDTIESIIEDNKDKFITQIANDNSDGQIVLIFTFLFILFTNPDNTFPGPISIK